MPVYDYLCNQCGAFTETRRMALSAAACDCPECGQASERAILTAPAIGRMDSGNRAAHATNERSAAAPHFSRKAERSEGGGGGHKPGCACCSTKTRKSKAVLTPDGSKMFPSRRPWMISH